MKNLLDRKVLVIDIGSGNIKIVQGVRSGKSIKVFKAVSIPTPRNSFDDGHINNIIALKGKISEALEINEIKTKSVIFTTESSAIITRIITVPMIKNLKEMESMIQLQMQQYLPIKFEDYIFQFIILETFKEEEQNSKLEQPEEDQEEKIEARKEKKLGLNTSLKINKNMFKRKEDVPTKARVRIAVIPKEMAEGYLDLAKELKLTPIGLDLNFNAVTKMFATEIKIGNGQYDKEETTVVIDIGQQSINVDIISRGICEFTKIISSGGINIDSNIAQQLGVDIFEAEKRKMYEGDLSAESFQKEDEELVNRVIRLVVDEWMREINKILQYYKNSNDGEIINSLYIHGGSSKIKGMEEYIANALNMSIECIKIIKDINLLDSVNGVETEYYLNAVGAIIKI
ncbi:MAG: type IV pilus assembly protein PilM [Clostridium sp.]